LVKNGGEAFELSTIFHMRDIAFRNLKQNESSAEKKIPNKIKGIWYKKRSLWT
jgi:hypothetical protein